MAVEADSVVVTLLAQNEQFDAANKASATGFSKSMSEIQSSGAAAEKGVTQFSSALKENRLGMNQSRIGMMEFQHIARGVSDQFASSGLSTQLFTSHIGELSEAIVLSGGAFGKLGLFLQGPWGIALTLATTAAATLIASHKKEGDGLDDLYTKLVKHKEQAALNSQADDIWSHSIDGLIDRSKKLNEEIEKRLETQTDLQKRTLTQAQEDAEAAFKAADKIQRNPNSTQAQIDAAQKAITDTSIALHNAQVLAGQDAGEAIASITKAAKTWSDEQLRAIREVQGLHPELGEKSNADQLLAAYYDLKDAIDKAAAANVDFNGTVTQTNRLNDELAHGTIAVSKYDQSIKSLAQSLRDAAAAGKDAIEKFKQAVIGAEGTGPNRLGSSAAGFGQFMPSTFEGYFKQLYPQQAGGMSNSQIDALRNNREIATAVIDAATKDYVTVLKNAGQQITAASLYTVHLLGSPDAKKLFNAPSGEQTSQFLSPKVLSGNPFLRGTAGDALAAIGKRIGDSSGAVSSGAAAIEKVIEDQAKKEAEQQAAFTSEMDGLNKDLLAARRAQTKDALAQLDFQEDEVRAEERKRDDTYQSAVTLGKLTQAQADQLKATAATVATEKLRALEIQTQIEIIQRQDEAAERTAQYRQDDLKAAEQAATSQAQRRELDLEILDILYQERLAHLERLKLIAEGNGEIDKANDLQAQIDHLPAQKAADRAGTLRGTMDPLESWLHNVPHDAKAVTEALQGIAANGFDQIASSIAGVVTGTESLGQAFSNLAKQVVSDLIQMTVKMLIFRALSGLIGLGNNALSPDLSMPSQVDIGGTGSLFSAPSLGSVTAGLPHMAAGGYGVIGGAGGGDTNLLSLNGRGVAWVKNGEGLAIMPNNGSAASPWSGGQSVMVVRVVSDDDKFGAFVESIAGPLAAQAGTRAVFAGAGKARNDFARRQVHALGSRG